MTESVAQWRLRQRLPWTTTPGCSDAGNVVGRTCGPGSGLGLWVPPPTIVGGTAAFSGFGRRRNETLELHHERVFAPHQAVQRFLNLGVDGGYFGDDYGAQKGPLFSPRTWRSLIKPRLARLFAPFRERGLPVMMHSDGQIQQILHNR